VVADACRNKGVRPTAGRTPMRTPVVKRQQNPATENAKRPRRFHCEARIEAKSRMLPAFRGAGGSTGRPHTRIEAPSSAREARAS